MPVSKAKQRERYHANKEKIRSQQKEYYQRNKERDRERHLLRKYGITISQYEELLKKQNDSCFLCQRPADSFKVRLAVDHDHTTGEIFGLLCWLCNHKIIGELRDPVIFERAAEYLRNGTGWFVPTGMEKPKRKRRRKSRG